MFDAVLDYIARTNLFNFIIFAGIIIYLMLKLDVAGILGRGTKSVEQKISDSNDVLEKSKEKLQTIEDKIANIENEIEEIIKQSENNARLVGSQILSDADKSVQNIETNTSKLIENKTAVLKNDIIKRVSVASVEVAKEQIIKELENNYDLHNKLIDESINAINEVNT